MLTTTRDIAGKTVLVTGGAGFIGSHLVDRCGLTEVLGMLRVRGLAGVLRRVKRDVARAASLQHAGR